RTDDNPEKRRTISAAAAIPAWRMSARDGMPDSIPRRSCSALSAADVTATGRQGMALRALRGVPGIVLLERLVEIEHREKIVAAVRRLADEQIQFDEREDDVADIRRRVNTPVSQDLPGQHAVAIQREIAARHRELAARDVAPLRQPRLAELERRED